KAIRAARGHGTNRRPSMGLSPFRCDPLNRDVPSCNSGSWSLSSSSILAKIFLELRVGPLVIAGVGVRLRQRLRIVRGHLVLEEPAACNRPEVLDQVERIAVPRTEVVPPCRLVESRRVHNQCVAFEPADRVTEVR